jgi:hypothetical protein
LKAIACVIAGPVAACPGHPRPTGIPLIARHRAKSPKIECCIAATSDFASGLKRVLSSPPDLSRQIRNTNSNFAETCPL